jgi:hypothetical protein
MSMWLANHGCEPIFVDNNSDYPPLLEYYEKTQFQVVRMDKNYGHEVVWRQGVIEKLGINENYLVTDPDLDLTGVPDDFVSVLQEGLRRYPNYDKCGLSLEINYLPIPSARVWEQQFWEHPLDPMYFHAEIDTTLALYEIAKQVRYPSYSAMRTNRPYTARHIPWSYVNAKDLPVDEQYYYRAQLPEIGDHSNVIGSQKL